MVRERIKELVDFVTTESPYRSATKGWLTADVYINWWSSSAEKKSRQLDEMANVSVYWKPINEIILILAFVLGLASVLVFLAVSFSHEKLGIPEVSPSILKSSSIEKEVQKK